MTTIRRFICALLTVTMVTGCMGPPRVVASPKTYLPIRRPQRIWVTEHGERVRVDRPRVLGDSLFGRRPNGEELWIGLDDPNVTIEAREMDKTRTLAAIGGAFGTVILISVFASGKGQPTVVENEDSYVGMQHQVRIPLLRVLH